MAFRVNWYKRGMIILFSMIDPVTLDEIEAGAEEVWALAAEVREPVDLVMDYRTVSELPRGLLPAVRDGHFALPMLDRVALVGHDHMMEMIISTITRDTFRPNPTLHEAIDEAAEFLLRMAQEDANRG